MKKVFALLLATAFTLGASTRAAAQSDDQNLKSVVGTWTVNVTAGEISICNGPTIAPGPPPFVELITYAAGGTVTETNSELNAHSAGSPLGLAGSDGHGAWERDDSEYHSIFRKLLFDLSGAYVGNADLNENLSIRASGELSGSFTIKLDFGNARPALCSSGTVTGQRLAP
ncbi:MAG: hypothetical protein JOZ10_13180 [Acidobacteria bacterium]|nr:hypothetical protein [Acidobacteriota bacterium]MBV9147461.1 hypothetical protein [Acidobacteriota bacterium]MBV9434432.1 hypothetical protein [Acidobacteriota bacterium]